MPITQAARERIVARIRDYRERDGGVLVFDAAGRGGTWYERKSFPMLDATDVAIVLVGDATPEELLDRALERDPDADAWTVCMHCGALIGRDRVAAAIARGQEPRYCSARCRSTAAKRRQRADV